jgi:predicted Zn-dependent protease with MMP-like domain
MNERDAELFDTMLEQEIEALPPRLARLVADQVAVIVLDTPDASLLAELGMSEDEALDLCGLHSGIGATDRSIEDDLVLPSQIHLFRDGIASLAGGMNGQAAMERVRVQIRITLLHEIGHEFGLDEEQLRELGYD